jgi:hypothetical protein
MILAAGSVKWKSGKVKQIDYLVDRLAEDNCRDRPANRIDGKSVEIDKPIMRLEYPV